MHKVLSPQDLRKYQWRTLRFMLENKAAGLLIDMGMGKTVSVLSAIKALKKRSELTKPVLVMGPLRVVDNVWRQEAQHWTHLQTLQFSLVRGNVKQRLRALAAPADIYLTNVENTVWLFEHLEKTYEGQEWPFDMLVVDESSLFKSHSTQRFKTLRKHVGKFKRRTIMTGTPTPNNMLELWSQMFILDEGQRLSPSYWRFRERYFEKADYMGYAYRMREGADHAINSKLKDAVIRLDAEDWLDMPPLIKNTIEVNMPQHAEELYDRLEKDMFIELMAGDVEVVSAAVLTQKCHQLANGAMYTIDRDSGMRNGWEEVHDAKINALKDVIEETSGNVLVAFTFKHDLARLQKAFPDAPLVGSNGKHAGQVINEWNAGKHRVLLVHPKSAGHGLNMQHGGRTIVFFSLPWSGEQHDQVIARIGPARRTGQTEPTVVHYIITRETVDTVILDTLERKARGQRALLNALRNYLEPRYGQR